MSTVLIIILFGCFMRIFSTFKQDSYLFWLSKFVLGLGYTIGFIICSIVHDHIGSAISGVFAIWHFYDFWRNRNKKDKNKSETYGEKTKEKIKEMVSNLTPSPIRSPIKDS